MEKTINEATSHELLLVLMHVWGIGTGPRKIVYAEPVLETLIPIGPDATARLLVFKEDLETLKLLCADITDEDLALFGQGVPKTLGELLLSQFIE